MATSYNYGEVRVNTPPLYYDGGRIQDNISNDLMDVRAKNVMLEGQVMTLQSQLLSAISHHQALAGRVHELESVVKLLAEQVLGVDTDD